MANVQPGLRDRIYKVVWRIPRGRVATYGQIAVLAGIPSLPRQVGYALAAHSDDGLPWHRVINAKGGISPRAFPLQELEQRRLLEKEGLRFDRYGHVDLRRVQWRPRDFVK